MYVLFCDYSPFCFISQSVLGIMYNTLADTASVGSISWTWMMSAGLFKACLTCGHLPLPRSTVAWVYPFEWFQIHFLFRLPLFKWLSRRPSPLSVIPFTTALDSVRVPKGEQEMSRCCPTACVSLSTWVWLCLPTADVPIIIAALPGIVFLR